MNQNTNVNVVPSYGQRGDLHFSQYDVGRTATINLYAVNEAYTIPVGATVKIQATKPSGLGFDVACTFSGSVVTVVSTETMTEESGRFPCELKIIDGDDVIGTANFMFCVEKSPHPDGTVDGDSEEIINEIEALVLQSEGWAVGTQNGVPVSSDSPYYENNSKWWAEHPVGGGITQAVKVALLNCFSHVAWIDGQGQTYYDALEDALYPPANLVSISAVYTQGGTVYDTDTLDSLKSDLVVTATYSDSSTETVASADYTLSGTLTVGTSTITVAYGGQSDTFDVTVTKAFLKNGVYDSEDGQIRFTITNGKHVKAEVLSSTLANFFMLNCGTGDISKSTSNAINNLPSILTIPANSSVTLEMKNITNYHGSGNNLQCILILRQALSSTSFLATSQSIHTEDVTVSKTATDATEIGAIGFGVNGTSSERIGTYVEFDVELTVGSEVVIG